MHVSSVGAMCCEAVGQRILLEALKDNGTLLHVGTWTGARARRMSETQQERMYVLHGQIHAALEQNRIWKQNENTAQ